jgi:ATP-binding cassette subfamily F protein 3
LKVLQRELGQVERTLLELQTEQQTLEARSSRSRSAPELAEVGSRLNQIAVELSRLEDRWLSLSEQIDRATRPIPS